VPIEVIITGGAADIKYSVSVFPCLETEVVRLVELFKSTDKEQEKFLKVFAISEGELTNVINALYFIIIQAAFERNFKPIEIQLVSAGIQGPQLQALQEAWTENGAAYVNRIKEKPIAVGNILDDMKWSLYVPFQEGRLPVKEKFNVSAPTEKFKLENLDSLYSNDARNPITLLNFEIKNLSEDGGKNENFAVKLNKADVQKVFEQLEVIQKNIDGLF